MSMPGFSAQASLYRSDHRYIATGDYSPASGFLVPQQLSMGLTDSDLAWCRLACLYCRYTGYYCWPCFICGLIISVGW
jgi:hypothetical protein